ncbi:MAG: transposase [Deltaproteobacteria bacterium]|jgi:transposase|nr:transposase [Deltaproteobacteria bacterium]
MAFYEIKTNIENPLTDLLSGVSINTTKEVDVAYLHISKPGNHYYIYGSYTQRRKTDKKVVRITKCLGKIDPITNSPIFNEAYLPWMTEHGLSIENALQNYINKTPKYNFINISKSTYTSKTNHPTVFKKFTLSNNNIGSSDDVGSIDNSASNETSGSVENSGATETSDSCAKITKYDKALLKTITLTIDELKNIDIKLIGATYLLKHISDSVGLTNILKKCFPSNWREILALTLFYTVESDALMYCHFFEDLFDTLSSPENLTSQDISGLFKEISDDERNLFFEEWTSHVKEIDYVVFDTTSISTYSTQNEDVAFVHPKQKSNKKQKRINVCLLFGEKTSLPLYLCTYNGSENDVASFISCSKQYQLIHDDNVRYVLDRGMFSKKNINYMLDSGIKFIIGLSASTKLKPELIENLQHIYQNVNYTITTNDNHIYGITKRIVWDSNNKLWAHVFVDQNKKLECQNLLLKTINDLYDKAIENPDDRLNDENYQKFILFQKVKNSKDKYIVKKNQEAFTLALANGGWFIFLSNNIKDTTEALSIYRQRDIVEKAFNIIKNRTQDENIAVHNSKKYSNKIFIGFLSLILTSQIHKIMVSNHLYENYTIKELYFILKSIKRIKVKNQIVYSPLTSKHKTILDVFNCPYPVDDF